MYDINLSTGPARQANTDKTAEMFAELAFAYVTSRQGWPVEPGTKATTEQLDAIRQALDAAGLWVDGEGDK